ncbi:MAG: complex I NDUFA9 subunit family protein, partial [Chakrabartia sp.]
LRPSIIFGREDSFINRFAGLIRALPVVPVIGGATKFQPVYVGDVAHAIVAALGEGHAGKAYELGGPQVFSMADLNRWIAKATGRDKMFVPVPDQVAALMAKLTGWLPGAPMLGSDNVVAPKAKGLSGLGITPTPLDVVAAGWLVQYRTHGRFGAQAS